MQGAELEVARSHPIGPGPVDADGEWCRGICLARDLNDPGGDPDLLFFSQAEDISACRPVNQVPERHPAAVTLNGLLDEIGHQAANRLSVSLPERNPVGNGAVAELDQRADLDREP